MQMVRFHISIERLDGRLEEEKKTQTKRNAKNARLIAWIKIFNNIDGGVWVPVCGYNCHLSPYIYSRAHLARILDETENRKERGEEKCVETRYDSSVSSARTRYWMDWMAPTEAVATTAAVTSRID